MKRPGLTRPFVSATLFLLVSSPLALAAQEMMATTPAAKAARRADDLLKRFDKNGDGKLDDDERADAKEMMLKEQVERQMARAAALPGGLEQFRAQALQMFDRNRDGRLDDEERIAAQKFAAMHRDGSVEAEALKKHFDQNGDGKIDAHEQARIEDFLAALRGVGGMQMRGELLRRFDQNADGKVDEAELAQLEKFVRPRIENSPLQLRRYDSNQDGKLSDAEWAVARSAIANWLSTSGPAALEAESMRQESVSDPRLRPADPSKTTSPDTPSGGERARLKAVEEEMLRRRAESEAALRAKAAK